MFFDFNKDVINKTSVVDLDNWLEQSSKVTILKIEGYCDSVDNNNYNKILAAKRANIKEIVLCEDNRKDILEIKESYLKGLTFHYVAEMKEVIDIALTKQKVKNAKKLVS